MGKTQKTKAATCTAIESAVINFSHDANMDSAEEILDDLYVAALESQMMDTWTPEMRGSAYVFIRELKDMFRHINAVGIPEWHSDKLANAN